MSIRCLPVSCSQKSKDFIYCNCLLCLSSFKCYFSLTATFCFNAIFHVQIPRLKIPDVLKKKSIIWWHYYPAGANVNNMHFVCFEYLQSWLRGLEWNWPAIRGNVTLYAWTDTFPYDCTVTANERAWVLCDISIRNDRPGIFVKSRVFVVLFFFIFFVLCCKKLVLRV